MKKTCFVIMPITTPNIYLKNYNNDLDHFKHVLEYLFIPAIIKAGFDPIVPIAEGADLIHASIVENLVDADLVLCDMSITNSNVFFELGIRTALNKSVCVIVDDKTEGVPFDTKIINYKVYKSDLSPWIIKKEIEKIAKHITISFNRNQDYNALWKYFGLKMNATVNLENNPVSSQLELIQLELNNIRGEISKAKMYDENFPKGITSDRFYIDLKDIKLGVHRIEYDLYVNFQEFLDSFFRKYLIKIVKPGSYTKKWHFRDLSTNKIIQKRDGNDYSQLSAVGIFPDSRIKLEIKEKTFSNSKS